MICKVVIRVGLNLIVLLPMCPCTPCCLLQKVFVISCCCTYPRATFLAHAIVEDILSSSSSSVLLLYSYSRISMLLATNSEGSVALLYLSCGPFLGPLWSYDGFKSSILALEQGQKSATYNTGRWRPREEHLLLRSAFLKTSTKSHLIDWRRFRRQIRSA